MKDGPVLVYTTYPSLVEAEKSGLKIIEVGLAACVNILPGMRSIYRWKGAVERDDELLCICKTTRDGFEKLRARVVELHPYEVPEVVALPIELGHTPYLAWLTASVG